MIILFLLPILLWLVKRGNALHFVGMKSSSRHTFALIDSTFCAPRIYILATGVLGRLTIGHMQPTQGKPNSLLHIALLCTIQLG